MARDDDDEIDPDTTSIDIKGDANDKIRRLFDEIEPLIDKVNGLYNLYFTGVEKRAPHEVHKRLENMVRELIQAPKLTATQRFRFGSIHARYIAHKDRWERTLKSMESGNRR